jgi:hypothetical protein
MAGLGAKLFSSFSKLTAAQVNGYLMDQSIMRFANAAARDAAFGGAGEPTLAEGMFCYLDDTNVLQSYNGSAWVEIASSDGKAPRGVVGYVYSTAGNVTLNTVVQDIAGASVTFTAVAGRLYKITYNAQLRKNLGASGYIEISFYNGATVIYDGFTDVAAGEYLNYSMSSVVSGLSGSVTLKATGIVNTGSATVFRQAANPTSFVVEDIGLA